MNALGPDNLMLRNRSAAYRGFAEAFRSPEGGGDFLDLVARLPRSDNAGSAFLDAFDPAVSDRACSLHESSYSRQERSALFEELVRWHAFFGLQRKDTAELPVHVSVELEFMHYLAHREQAQGDDPAASDSLRRAQHEFLDRHLIPLANGIQKGCRSDDPRYRRLPACLIDFLHRDYERMSGEPS